jgi:hypothetical protein
MKKFYIGLIALLMVTVVSGQEKAIDGEKVFDRDCASCHIKNIKRDEAMKMRQTLKAPPMMEVSNHLKNNIQIISDLDDEIHRAVVIAFIKDYVEYPHMDKAMCEAMALDRFSVMPSLKGKLTPEELTAVAEWTYDYYVGKKF